MSRYSRGYIQTHDIDWFCILDDRFPIHVGSCGGMLPGFARDRDVNRRWQNIVDNLPEDYDTDWNREYVSRRLERNTNLEVTPESFTENFLYFARRGFYSFYRDLHREEGEERETYTLIAWPKDDIHLLILKILCKYDFPCDCSKEIEKRIYQLVINHTVTNLEHIPILDYLKE